MAVKRDRKQPDLTQQLTQPDIGTPAKMPSTELPDDSLMATAYRRLWLDFDRVGARLGSVNQRF